MGTLAQFVMVVFVVAGGSLGLALFGHLGLLAGALLFGFVGGALGMAVEGWAQGRLLRPRQPTRREES